MARTRPALLLKLRAGARLPDGPRLAVPILGGGPALSCRPMAKLHPQPGQIVKAGKLGPLIVRRLNEDWVVQMAPTGPRKPATALQRAQRGRWAAAKRYGKGQSDEPASKALYRSGVDGRCRSAYAVAIRDYLNAPTVTAVDAAGYHGRPGDGLRVWAVDDFAVVAVRVRLLHPDGTEREAGPAVLQANGSWYYTATAAGPVPTGSVVVAEARDRPGNIGQLQEPLPVVVAAAPEPEPDEDEDKHAGQRNQTRSSRSLEAPAFRYASGTGRGGRKVARRSAIRAASASFRRAGRGWKRAEPGVRGWLATSGPASGRGADPGGFLAGGQAAGGPAQLNRAARDNRV